MVFLYMIGNVGIDLAINLLGLDWRLATPVKAGLVFVWLRHHWPAMSDAIISWRVFRELVRDGL